MGTKELGQTGVALPEVGIGTWNYHAGPDPLRKGLEAGARFLDTAESYGTEGDVGQAIRGIRERVFVATKVSPQNFRAADLRRSVDASLARLGVDQIDLLQLHEPNPGIPISETMDAVSRLITAGKVRFAGVSNFSVAQLMAAQAALGRYPVVSNQVRYSVIDRTIEKDLLPYCQAHHITVIAYCPLARGLNRIRDCDPTGALDEVARQAGRSIAQVALNWCLCQEGVVVIPKGNTAAHILDNCGAAGWRLTGAQLSTLNSRIRYRHRNRFDELVRRYTPDVLRGAALQAIRLLPPELRRRVN